MSVGVSENAKSTAPAAYEEIVVADPSPEAWARIVGQLLANPARRAALAQAALTEVERNRPSWDDVRRLLVFECERARDFYQRAIDARPEEDRRRLVAAEIMRAVYFATLRRIERNGYDVFHGRVRLSRARQAVVALRQWIWNRWR